MPGWVNSIQKISDGAGGYDEWNGGIAGPPGILETRTIVIDGAADVVTDTTLPITPVAAELRTLNNFAAGTKRARLSFHVQQAGAATDIPWTNLVLVTLNAGDNTTALSRLTLADSSTVNSNDTRQRMLSKDNPIIEYDLTRTDVDITRIDLVALTSVGTPTLPVYISCEVLS